MKNPFAQNAAENTAAPVANPFARHASPFEANPLNNGRSPSPFGQPSGAPKKADNPFAKAAASNGAAAFGKASPPRSLNGKRKGQEPSQNSSKFSRNSPDPHFASKRHSSPLSSKPERHKNGHDRNPSKAIGSSTPASTELGARIQQQLAKDKVFPPEWPSNPGSQASRSAVEKFRTAYIQYREKALKSLVKSHLIDDPDRQIRLEDAIPFKGVCEEMCPDWDRLTRIFQKDVKKEERVTIDGEDVASLPLMVTRYSRSSAGQEVPLPMDVRTPAALRRTLEYLIKDLVPRDEDLPDRHHFLWDRTRAIRRDFTFQTPALNKEEKVDMVHCLETIGRFHVTALHIMTKPGFAPEDFSEQQEIEQLSKTFTSLMQAYEDCAKQGIICDNEAEFRAYYVLLHANSSAILETVQSWEPKFWGNELVKNALCLSQALQNTWTAQGPLNPKASVDMAMSMASGYFDLVAKPSVSYTMGCFAELHFGAARRSILTVVQKGYERPKGGPKDITLRLLRRYLRFATDEEAQDFATLHGFEFDEGGEQPTLKIERGHRVPYERISHWHSELVESKRGQHSFPDVVYTTVCVNDPNDEKRWAAGLRDDGDSAMDASKIKSGFNGRAQTSLQGFAQPTSTPFSSFGGFGGSQQSLPPPTSSEFSQPAQVTEPKPGPQTAATPSPFSMFSQPATTKLFAPANATTTTPATGQSTTPAGSPDKPTFPSSSISSNTFQKQISEAGSILKQQPCSEAASTGAEKKVRFAPETTATQDSSSNKSKDTSTTVNGSNLFGFLGPSSAVNEASKPDLKEPEPSKPGLAGSPFMFGGPGQLFGQPQGAEPAALPEPKDVTKQASSLAAPSMFPTPAASALSSAPASALTSASSNATGLPQSALFGQSKAAPATAETPVLPKKDLIGDFNKWFVKGDYGLLDEVLLPQIVADLLGEVMVRFRQEEEEKKRKAEDEESWAKARNFRRYSLGVTYFYRWRDIAQKKRAIRRLQTARETARQWRSPAEKAKREKEVKAAKAKEAREARDLMVERSHRQMKEEEQLRQSTRNERRAKTEAISQAILASGVMSGVRDPHAAAEYAAGVDDQDRAMSTSSTGLTVPEEKRRLQLENARRKQRGLKPLVRFPEPATYKEGTKTAKLRALTKGGSGRDSISASATNPRTSTFSSSYRSSTGYNDGRVAKATSSKATDHYWRMKASGLVQMPNGEYLHESLALPMIRDGKRFPGLGDYGLGREQSVMTPSVSPQPEEEEEEAAAAAAGESERRQSPPHLLKGLSRSRASRSPSLVSISTQKRKRLFGSDDDLGQSILGPSPLRRSASVGSRKRARSSIEESRQAEASSQDGDFMSKIDSLMKEVHDLQKSS